MDEYQDRQGRGAESGSSPGSAGLIPSATRGGGLAAFLAERDLPSYAGEPIRPSDSVSAAIQKFHPNSLPPELWSRIEGFVTDAVEQAVPNTVTTAMTLMTIVTHLVVWVDTLGYPITLESVFHPDVVDRFCAEGCAQYKPGTRHNYRTWLKDAGRTLCPELYPPKQLVIPRSDPQAPYTDAEISAIFAWARGLSTQSRRHNISVLLTLALGAGLTSKDINRMLGTQITVDSEGVLVHVDGEKPRSVPALRDYEDAIAGIGRVAGSQQVFLPGRRTLSHRSIPNYLAKCAKDGGVRPNMNRLRTTWVVTHLSSGTQLGALAEAAGVDVNQLVRYQQYATALPQDEGRRQLREAGER